MFSNFSEGFSPKFTSIEDLVNLNSFGISFEPIIGKEHEPESKPEKEVKTQLHKTQLFDDSSIKEFSNTLFEQVIKPELSTAMNSIIEHYKERIDELEDRLSTFRRFMYAKGLEHSYEQWLTKRIQIAKEEDNDEPLFISLQHGMKDVEIMRD